MRLPVIIVNIVRPWTIFSIKLGQNAIEYSLFQRLLHPVMSKTGKCIGEKHGIVSRTTMRVGLA